MSAKVRHRRRRRMRAQESKLLERLRAARGASIRHRAAAALVKILRRLNTPFAVRTLLTLESIYPDL